uniref:Uncharacterized protein n=1 Tax=Picea glauca TaxID=3330 RepID=A0A101LX09_PICGL|nr:hypothetical protein ABT39_MTgene6371 [Picea glauca]QHR86307.1 hypothetical protein Q903MT_gene306 [Picea sitchensis]
MASILMCVTFDWRNLIGGNNSSDRSILYWVFFIIIQRVLVFRSICLIGGGQSVLFDAVCV